MQHGEATARRRARQRDSLQEGGEEREGGQGGKVTNHCRWMALARRQAVCLQMRTGRQHGPDRKYMYAQLDLKPNLSNESVSLDMQSMRVRTGICVRGARSGWPTSTRAYGGAGERQCTAARAWWREGDSGGNARTHNTEKGLLAGVHASETALRREVREGAQGGKVGVYVRWVGMRAKAARLGEGEGRWCAQTSPIWAALRG